MRRMRLFLACFIAACTAVPVASPAVAQEPECPDTWLWDTVDAVFPNVSEQFVELGDGTVTIRGDLAASVAARLLDHYRGAIERAVTCAVELAVGDVTPYVECVLAQSAPILTAPDPVARYVRAGTDLVVTIDYGQALDDAIAIANCNGIVTYGG